MRLKKLLTIFIMIALIGLPLFASKNLSKITAGRVRFALGHPNVTFNGKTYDVGFDYLVLLGSTYNTNDGKLELVDFNNSTYWFDKNTKFHFETIDIGGNKTTLYFGKGKAIIKTKKPVILLVASASVFLPEKGEYLVMRDIEGKDKVYITDLTHKNRPYFVKKNKIFSRVYFNRKSDSELISWVKRRKHDWALTKSRMLMNSMVNRMPPIIAYTDDGGKTHWYRVSYVKPIYQISNILFDNYFIFDPVLIHAFGLLSPHTIYMTDFELWLWFDTNRFNSIRWAWDPFHGWHAEFYYDPLAGYGAEYGFSPAYLAWYADLCDYLNRAGLIYRDGCIYDNFYFRGRDIIKPLPKPHYEVYRFVKKPLLVRARLSTDPVIRNARLAAKLGLREGDYRRVDYYSRGGRRYFRHTTLTGVDRSSYGSIGRPIYTIHPVRVISSSSRSSRRTAAK